MQKPEFKGYQLKVCGMREPQNIEQLLQLPIQWMGLIFYKKSPRLVDVETQQYIRQNPHLFKAIKKVGVFVNASLQEIHQQIVDFRLDALQLHGDESPARCAELKQQYPHLQLLKAIRLKESTDLLSTRQYSGTADFFLFDTKGPSYGGTGQRFDWSILEDYQEPIPFFLSGGLSPAALDEVLAFQHPQCIGLDLNSGFELAPGLKDINRLRNFFQLLNKSTHVYRQ